MEEFYHRFGGVTIPYSVKSRNPILCLYSNTWDSGFYFSCLLWQVFLSQIPLTAFLAAILPKVVLRPAAAPPIRLG